MPSLLSSSLLASSASNNFPAELEDDHSPARKKQRTDELLDQDLSAIEVEGDSLYF